MYVFGNSKSVEDKKITREPLCPEGAWYVYRNARGKYHAVDEGNRISLIELKANNYKSRCTVTKDVYTYKYFGEHHSADPGRDFQVSVQVNISVADPVAVVQHNVSNIQDYMSVNIKHWIEVITVQYKVEDFHQLKDKIHDLALNSNMIKELEKRGFQLYQLQAAASLGQREWEFYEKQETIKRNAALELARIEEEEKIRLAEAQIRQQEEQAQKERELREEQAQKERKLSEEQIRIERERIARDERQKENERLAELGEKKGIDRIILERSSENQENLDMLINKDLEEKNLKLKLEQERIEYERKKEQEERDFQRQKELEELKHKRGLENRKFDMLEKMISISAATGDIDPELIRQMREVFAPSSEPSQVETKKTERIEWGSKSQVLANDSDNNENGWG